MWDGLKILEADVDLVTLFESDNAVCQTGLAKPSLLKQTRCKAASYAGNGCWLMAGKDWRTGHENTERCILLRLQTCLNVVDGDWEVDSLDCNSGLLEDLPKTENCKIWNCQPANSKWLKCQQ